MPLWMVLLVGWRLNSICNMMGFLDFTGGIIKIETITHGMVVANASSSTVLVKGSKQAIHLLNPPTGCTQKSTQTTACVAVPFLPTAETEWGVSDTMVAGRVLANNESKHAACMHRQTVLTHTTAALVHNTLSFAKQQTKQLQNAYKSRQQRAAKKKQINKVHGNTTIGLQLSIV